MTPKQIDCFCGKLPAATRTVQWEGVIVFKVGGKMFCLIAPEDHSVGRISFKSAPEHYEALSRSPGFRPAPYLARAKWVSVDDPKALTDREMKAYINGPRRHRRRAAQEEAGRIGPLKRPRRAGCGPSRLCYKPAPASHRFRGRGRIPFIRPAVSP